LPCLVVAAAVFVVVVVFIVHVIVWLLNAPSMAQAARLARFCSIFTSDSTIASQAKPRVLLLLELLAL